MVRRASLCGLGKTAPNPVLSSLRFFREEFEAHLHGRCPAGKCRDLITYSVTDACIGCTLCAQHCPVSAIPDDSLSETFHHRRPLHPLQRLPRGLPRGCDPGAVTGPVH